MAMDTIHLDFADIGVGREKKKIPFYEILSRHYTISLSDRPDFLIFGHSGQRHRLHRCVKIYWTVESYEPDYAICDYSVTHHADTERNLRLPLYAIWTKADLLIKDDAYADRIMAEPRDFCSFFTSYVSPKIRHRLSFFEKLNHYRTVASAGKALNNIGRKIPYGLGAKLDFMRGYKFYMAFENESMPGYTTEKIAEAMLAGCIPIYWGNPEITKEFNPDSFINCMDYESDAAVIEHIKEVDQDDALYRRYLEAPFFYHNQPNIYFDQSRVVDFFEKVFTRTEPSVSDARSSRIFGRWTVAKQDQPPKLEAVTGERPRVSIDFADYGPRCEKEQIYLYKTLSKYFELTLCDNPDFLIYSHGGDTHKLFSGTKIYWTNEAYAPNWNDTDYALTCRYLDHPRHLRFPFYAEWVPAEDLIKKADDVDELIERKTKFCAFFSSYENRKTRHRFAFLDRLNAFKHVDCAGRARNNINLQVPYNTPAKLEFLRDYRFYIAFENQSVPGYVTEKIIEAMAARCIPIYYGCPRVVEEFNPDSFINYHSFASVDALIERIKQIEEDPDLYRHYLKAPFFHDDQPNKYFSEDRLVNFFRKVFTTPPGNLPRRRQHPVFSRWKLVRKNRIN